jgi:hypothetical protein
MDRYILRYQGELPRPQADVERIETCSDLRILDATSPRLLLVEGAAEALEALIDSLPNWILTRERSIPLPDTRRRTEGEKRSGIRKPRSP